MVIEPQARVLITGAASGLGLALAAQLALRGCRVLATDVHDPDGGGAIPAAFSGLDNVAYRKLDVTSDVDWATARDWVVETWDGLDYLFNNAVKAGVVALSETLWHELKPFGVNVSVICPTFFKTNLTHSLRGKDEAAQKSAARLIDKATVTADDIAATVIRGVEKNTHIILTDRNGRMAYAAKRFVRPIYYQMMAKVSRQMAAKD